MSVALPMVKKMISDLVKSAPKIPTWVLISFNDPDAKLVKKTSNVAELKKSLDSLDYNGGGDLPEVALKGGIFDQQFSNYKQRITYESSLCLSKDISCSWCNLVFRSGLDITLDEMPNNGVVLVVTSAGSHQLELEKSIKEKSSKKNVKIYFTFSPFCREACGDSLPVYKRLSDNRMFNLSDFSSKSFLETVVYTV